MCRDEADTQRGGDARSLQERPAIRRAVEVGDRGRNQHQDGKGEQEDAVQEQRRQEELEPHDGYAMLRTEEGARF